MPKVILKSGRWTCLRREEDEPMGTYGDHWAVAESPVGHVVLEHIEQEEPAVMLSTAKGHVTTIVIPLDVVDFVAHSGRSRRGDGLP